MRNPIRSSPSTRLSRCLVSISVFIAAALLVASSTQIKPVPPVPAAALQKLLPAVDGWTTGVTRADQVVLSPEATYSFASVTLVKDDLRVKMTLSDTGGSTDSLRALAMVIVSMPPDFAEEVQGATVKRTQFAGSPASEFWDGQKKSGEITVLVGGRFVAAVEASKIDALATLRGILEKIDLKSLAGLK